MKLSGSVCAVALLVITACQSQTPTPHSPEVLRMSIQRDPISLDPKQIHQPSAELGLIRNLYDGLYKFDNDLKEVPDLATAPPTVSNDGKTWTFHLKPEARFGNGDHVTAADVIYSWTRDAAQPNDPDAYVFQPVAGFDALQSGASKVLTGLSSPDPETVVAQLSAPTGYWLVELGLWPGYVVNERVLVEHGQAAWWTDPQNLNASATGPFQLSKWDHGSSLDFKPTPNWWDGGTGTLAGVHAEVVSDASDALSRYEQGQLDVIGYSPKDAPVAPEVPIDALQRYAADKSLASQVVSRPWLVSAFLRFNTITGPLSGSAAQPARKALSQAIDRRALAAAACDGGLTCIAATGGIFLKGLQGYLGDGQDRNAQFDPVAAKAAFRSWDSDGSKARAIRLTTISDFEPIAKEVQRQWKTNLGLIVPLDTVGSYPQTWPAVLAAGFVVDFDSPSDWFDGITGSSYYSNVAFDSLVARGDALLPPQALPVDLQAEGMLQSEVAVSALAYLAGVFLVKPRVHGAGGNALYEYYWSGISIQTG